MASIAKVLINGKEASKVLINNSEWFSKNVSAASTESANNQQQEVLEAQVDQA